MDGGEREGCLCKPVDQKLRPALMVIVVGYLPGEKYFLGRASGVVDHATEVI